MGYSGNLIRIKNIKFFMRQIMDKHLKAQDKVHSPLGLLLFSPEFNILK